MTVGLAVLYVCVNIVAQLAPCPLPIESSLHHLNDCAAAGPDAAEPMEAADSPSAAAPAGEKQREGSSLTPADAEDDDEALLRCAEAAEAGAAAAVATPHLARVVLTSVYYPIGIITTWCILALHLAQRQVQQMSETRPAVQVHGQGIEAVKQ